MLPGRLCVCLLCVCFSAFEASGAQEDSLPNDTNIILELLPDVGRPGEQSFIAISLVTSGDTVKTGIGQILCQIYFPSHYLTFREVKPGRAADRVAAQVSSELQGAAKENPELSRIEIIVTSEEDLPNGTVANVIFQVSEEAPSGTLIRLESKGRALALDGTEMGSVTGGSTEIQITGQPVPLAGCFFYMH